MVALVEHFEVYTKLLLICLFYLVFLSLASRNMQGFFCDDACLTMKLSKYNEGWFAYITRLAQEYHFVG